MATRFPWGAHMRVAARRCSPSVTDPTRRRHLAPYSSVLEIQQCRQRVDIDTATLVGKGYQASGHGQHLVGCLPNLLCSLLNPVDILLRQSISDLRITCRTAEKEEDILSGGKAKGVDQGPRKSVRPPSRMQRARNGTLKLCNRPTRPHPDTTKPSYGMIALEKKNSSGEPLIPRAMDTRSQPHAICRTCSTVSRRAA